MGRLLSTNTLAGIRRTWHEDRGTGDVTVHTQQDVTAVIEDNKAIYNTFDERSRHPGDGFHMVARVPIALYFKLFRDGVTEDPKALLKALEANPHFKTRPGRLI